MADQKIKLHDFWITEWDIKKYDSGSVTMNRSFKNVLNGKKYRASGVSEGDHVIVVIMEIQDIYYNTEKEIQKNVHYEKFIHEIISIKFATGNMDLISLISDLFIIHEIAIIESKIIKKAIDIFFKAGNKQT